MRALDPRNRPTRRKDSMKTEFKRRKISPTQCKAVRKYYRISQATLADKAGVATQTVSRFEQGDDVGPNTREKLARVVAPLHEQMWKELKKSGDLADGEIQQEKNIDPPKMPERPSLREEAPEPALTITIKFSGRLVEELVGAAGRLGR